MLFGVGCYSFVVGTITSVLTSIDEHNTKINAKLLKIEMFAKDTMLPQDLTAKLIKSLKDCAETTSLDDYERINIILHLPKQLKYDMAMSMYDNSIRKLSFFKDKDSSFIADIGLLLKYMEVNDQDYLYKFKDYADELYFLIDGKVGYVYGTRNFVFKNMIKGSYFGEIELIEQQPRKFAAMALEKCKFLTMKKHIFDTMMIEYPSVS